VSLENIETVRRLFERYERGDYDAALEYLDPEVVYETGQELPAIGRAAVRQMWERWGDAWDEMETFTGDYVDAGDHVLATVRYSGRGKASGIEHDDVLFDVYTFRDGLCVRKQEFRERAEALRAAGLTT
jgi:ketosteroid isomerase-like protein